MSRSVVLVPLVIGLGLGAVALWQGAAARLTALPVYGQVPAFALIDHRGQPVSQETLRGTPWIADFIFTRCAGQCPMMSAQMATIASAVPQGVRLISITVDPSWDTPEVLTRYAETYATDARWLFVTGDPEAIRRLCQEGFRLSVSEDGASAREPITHSTRLVLVDRQGRIRGYYEATDEAAVRQLRRDLRRVL